MLKQTFLALAIALPLATSAAFAHSHGPHADKMIERLDRKLDLTEAQKTQVRDILAASQAEHQKLREQTHEKVSAVLTPEQQAKFESLKQARMSKGERHHRRAPTPEKMVKRLQRRLDLSEQQSAQVLSIIQANQAGEASMDREQRQALRTQMSREIAGVLTAEQAAKFESMRDHYEKRHSHHD